MLQHRSVCSLFLVRRAFLASRPRGRPHRCGDPVEHRNHRGTEGTLSAHSRDGSTATAGATPVGNSKRLRNTLFTKDVRVCDGRHTSHLKLCVTECAGTRNLPRNSLVSQRYCRPMLDNRPSLSLRINAVNAPRFQPVPDNRPEPPETAAARGQRCLGCRQSSTHSS